jgi:hypothetical protein
MADPTAAELQKKLDDLAERERTVAEKEEKQKVFEAAAKQKTEELEAKAKSIVSEKESVVKDLETVKAAMVKLDASYREKIAELEKKPLIEKLKELENEYSFKAYQSYIEKEMSVEQLTARVTCLEKQKKAAPPPIVIAKTGTKEGDGQKGPTFEEIMKSAEDLPEETRSNIRKMLTGDNESQKAIDGFLAIVKKEIAGASK